MNGIFLAILGAAIATVLAGVGSAKGVGSAAQTAMGVLSEDSSMFGKMLVLTLLPGIVGFLILVSSGVLSGAPNVTVAQGFAYAGASLAIGFGGLFSGIAQGKAAVSGIAMTAKDEKNFSKGMVSVTLVEIYALLAFIVSLLVVIQVPNFG